MTRGIEGLWSPSQRTLSIDNSASLDSPNRTDLYTKGRLYSGIQSLVVEEAVVARQRPSEVAVAVAMQPLHQVAVAERIAARRLHMTPGSGAPWSPSRRIPSIDSSASYRNPNRIDRCTSDRRYRAGLRQTRVVAAEEEAVAMQPLHPVEVVVVVEATPRAHRIERRRLHTTRGIGPLWSPNQRTLSIGN